MDDGFDAAVIGGLLVFAGARRTRAIGHQTAVAIATCAIVALAGLLFVNEFVRSGRRWNH